MSVCSEQNRIAVHIPLATALRAARHQFLLPSSPKSPTSSPRKKSHFPRRLFPQPFAVSQSETLVPLVQRKTCPNPRNRHCAPFPNVPKRSTPFPHIKFAERTHFSARTPVNHHSSITTQTKPFKPTQIHPKTPFPTQNRGFRLIPLD